MGIIRYWMYSVSVLHFTQNVYRLKRTAYQNLELYFPCFQFSKLRNKLFQVNALCSFTFYWQGREPNKSPATLAMFWLGLASKIWAHHWPPKQGVIVGDILQSCKRERTFICPLFFLSTFSRLFCSPFYFSFFFIHSLFGPPPSLAATDNRLVCLVVKPAVAPLLLTHSCLPNKK
jgi:hypothetical protein